MKLLLRIITLFLKTLVVPLMLVLFLGGTIYFLGATTAGLQTTLKIAGKVLPGELYVQHAQGRLFSQFTLNNISYRHAGDEITVQFFEFKWQPALLLEAKLDIEHLLAHHVTIKSSGPSKPFSYDEIPYYLQHIHVHQLQVSNLTYTGNDNVPFTVTAINLQQNAAEDFTFSAELLNGSIQGSIAKEWNANWHFQVPDLAKLSPQARGMLTLSGTITGPRLAPAIVADLHAEKLFFNADTVNQLNGKINITLKPDVASSATLTATGIKIQDHIFQDVAVSLTGQTHLTAKQYETAVVIALNKIPYLNMQLVLQKNFDLKHYATQSIYAKVNADTINLQTLARYLPAIKNLHGNLIGSLEAQGTLTTPHFFGDISLNNGNISVPALGVTFKNIALHARGDESKLLHYTGTLTAGTGTATLSGSTDFSQADFASSINLQGSNLQLMNLEEYKITASPDLTVTLANHILSIHGNVLVPAAKIAPKNFSSVVTLPSDVVFVGEKKANATSALDFLPTLQITVTLGDKIYLHYQDLEAVLKGKVVISKEAHSPATGSGELYTSKGTYNAYKKILTIKQGRLMYTGNVITNPGLNIKASREMKTVSTGAIGDFSSATAYTGSEMLTVGVQVLGTLEKPVISLFSQPALSQNDMLSYLILGVPYSPSGSSSQAILSAASALSLGSGDNGSTSLGNITQKIQKTFGLTEMNVESVQTYNQTSGGVDSKTSLVLGKQLAPNLYVHYSTSFDLLNPVSTFNLRYKLSKRFSIQSETSTIDTGADLLYSIERG